MKTVYLSVRHDGITILDQVKQAADFSSRLCGLMFYRVFPNMDGMLFYPCRSVHTFWMRFALDLIMMDSDGRIVNSFEDVGPNRIIRGSSEAVYVLEVSAGTIDRWRLRVGDVLRWDGLAK